MSSNEFLTFEDFYGRYYGAGKTQLARLLKLSNAIEKWCQAGAAKNAEVIKEFSITDVQALRQLIADEVSLIGADEPNVVTDQILFLIIGAVKVQTQSNASMTWPLVNQTIKELVSPSRKQNSLMHYFLLTGFILIAGFAFTLFSVNNKNIPATALNSIEAAQELPVNQVGSQIVGHLINVYQKMQQGDCQLPQALVLQPEDRETFIAFVTEGKVNISTAKSLSRSLSYADCKYAQKLMSNPLNIPKDNG